MARRTEDGVDKGDISHGTGSAFNPDARQPGVSQNDSPAEGQTSDARGSGKPEPRDEGRGSGSGDSKLVKLRILDKEVQLACPSGEENELLQAAAYVNRAMQELRRRNTTSSIEKIAIVTAINTASSLLQSRDRAGGDESIGSRLSTLNRRIDAALTDDGDPD